MIDEKKMKLRKELKILKKADEIMEKYLGGEYVYTGWYHGPSSAKKIIEMKLIFDKE